jgi:hypothetical protein
MQQACQNIVVLFPWVMIFAKTFHLEERRLPMDIARNLRFRLIGMNTYLMKQRYLKMSEN